MKVLLVSETLHVGGAETFVVRLANGLARAGHQVMLAVLFDSIVNESLLAQIAPDVSVQRIATPALRLWQKADGALRRIGLDHSLLHRHFELKLLHLIDTFRPDAVHSNLFHTDWVVARARRASNWSFRHVITVHGDYSSFFHGEANSGFLHIRHKMQEIIRQSDAIVCLCEEHERFFPANYPAESAGKLHVVYNGYRPADEAYRTKTKASLGLPENKFIFGMVSRGVEKKGWRKAVDAFIKAEMPDAKLILVGTGDYLVELSTQVQHADIVFAGFSAVPVEYIQHFDVCLLPSLFSYESLPTVVIEYLYCGKPVIATDVGEIKKMITAPNGQQAGQLLSFAGQDVQVAELSAKMQDIYQQRDQLEMLHSIAWQAFEKFDMEECVKQYITIYCE